MSNETLMNLVKEYGNSLLRVDSEKDLQKTMAERAEKECSVKPAHFRKVSNAYYKDKLSDMREDNHGQLDLLDSILES